MKRYLISMAIRTVCVVLAVVVSGPLRWIFIAGAVLLPYIAVVMANAVGERRQRIGVVPGPSQAALPAAEDQPGRPLHIYIPDPGDGPEDDVASAERMIPGSGERIP